MAAYVVDGLSAKRVLPVLEVALTRFQLMQKLRGDLAKAQADLAARKTIDKAKGLLMKERGMDENAAYQRAAQAGRPWTAAGPWRRSRRISSPTPMC